LNILYRSFHNELRDYKNLLLEYRRTHIYETCTDRRNNSQFFFPSKLFFIVVYLSAARRCAYMWSLCNVHFVQCTQRTCLQTRTFVRGIHNLLKLGVCASGNQVVVFTYGIPRCVLIKLGRESTVNTAL
jgi:hypothetical protein